MKRILSSFVTLCLATLLWAAPEGFFNVRDFGAKGDGAHTDSPAINAAIEAASEKGGGTVYLPAGVYLSYSIRLKNNISLYLDNGVVLKAAVPNDSAHYDLPEENPSDDYQDFGHSHWQNSLIWGIALHDISIQGFGLIDGTEGITRGQAKMNGHPAANKAIALKECRNVTIRDISMLKCGHFAMLLTGVDNLTIDNVRCDTNRDAFDIDCCANVRVSNCQVNTLNDDAIVLKCSYGLGYAKATENVTITNCHVSGYDPGTMLDGTYQKTITAAPDRDGPTGRIKLGTESNGGFKNITISNCTFDHCRGLALETVDGAVIEDVTIDNIVMRDICNSPIYIRLGNRARGPEGMPVSVIRRVKLSNIVVKEADCRYASIIFGLEGHPIEDVSLSNIHIQYRGGLTMDDVRWQRGANPFFTRMNERVNDVGKGRRRDRSENEHTPQERQPYDVPQMEKGYPEPSSHGILPAYGLFVSHARGVTIDNVTLETIREDQRPPIVLMDVEDIKLSNMKVDKAEEVPYIVMKQAKDLRVEGFRGVKDRVVAVASDKEIVK
ncbi:MAG: glycoside hydrolase family 28 protein [Bacteroidaceae bacterium]|nr:glycoside hydrolase family 28 protein [Bacteroidaceae bacterium]